MWVTFTQLIAAPCVTCHNLCTGPRRHEGHASARFGDRGEVYLDGEALPRVYEADMAAGWAVVADSPAKRCLAGNHVYMYKVYGSVLVRLKGPID